MWTFKNADGSNRSLNAAYSNNRYCFLCGQYFKKNEKFYIIVVPYNLRSLSKKFSKNISVHADEWEEFIKDVKSDEELAEKLIAHKTPHRKKFTEEEQHRIKCFQEACYHYNFKQVYDKPWGLKCKQVHSSCYLEYNVHLDKIDLDSRGREGLFDGFYKRQIIANIYNKMHELLGDNKFDSYNYKDSINEVNKQVNEMMKEIF